MKNMSLKPIAQVVDGQLYFPLEYEVEDNKVIAGVVTDNRQIEKDFLFIPMVGARVDGHDFIEDAFEKGAYAVLSQKKLDNPKGPYILVKDTPTSLKQIATYYRQQLSIPVIGVIGSVGKTSTKEMIASVLSAKYEVLKTEGNYNNEIGLPLTVLRIRDYHQVAVVEMGISDFGEMHRLGDIAKPDYVVITNIGQCHLEFLHNRDGILRAKTEVFEHMPSSGCVILNGDDDKLIDADTLGLKTIYYGLGEHEYSASTVEADGVTGIKADIHTPLGDISVKIPLPGEHNVMNGLAAAALGLQLGLDLENITDGLNHAKTISGRNNLMVVNGITIIDDCYNANPVSMKASIEVLGKATGRTIAVLGDMGELGDKEVELHANLSQVIEDNQICMLFTVGTLSENIHTTLQQHNSSCMCHHYGKVEDLLTDLLPVLRVGDTVLIKASHFMNFPVIVDAIKKRFE